MAAGDTVSPNSALVMMTIAHGCEPDLLHLRCAMPYHGMPPRSDALTEQAPIAPATRAPSSKRLEPLRHVDAGVLRTAYYEASQVTATDVLLMHGFTYNFQVYVAVIPSLAPE
jgi:hypothetical protein